MIQPTLNEIATARDMVDVFHGYNHNLRINDSEFYDMKNLTSTHYPILSPRERRGLYTTPANPQGLISKDALCYVDGPDFVINDYHIEMGLSVKEKDCPKQLISMGAHVIILPDAKWINTAKWNGDTFDAYDDDGNIVGYGDINVKNPSLSGWVKFTLCTLEGEAYDIKYTDSSEPTGKDTDGNSILSNGDLWLDQSTTPHSLKRFAESTGMWVSVPTVYVKITSPGIGVGIEQYDGVSISGLKGKTLHYYNTENNEAIVGVTADQIAALDGTAVVWARDDDYIVVVGIIDTEVTISDQITIARQMPAMDFVTESENRLWGCRYGVANNGDVVNEIYASKLGDFKNWTCYMGLSTDSYAASCGTDGQFTGAITHLGYPLFFKENCIHKVYGNYPANYQIQTINGRGVEKGSSKSLAIVNEVLYYKSRSGVCAYDGSLPAEMSQTLGEVRYTNAVAGANGNKYYISMKDEAGTYHLFVYDASKGLWHKEDNTQVDSFCSNQGVMYYIDHTDKKIKTTQLQDNAAEDHIPWMAETGALGISMPDKKYISRLLVRMSMALHAKVKFSIQYDSMGEWEELFSMVGTSLKTFTVPVRPRRCDHFRLRIEGVGDTKIYSITKTIEQGSDI